MLHDPARASAPGTRPGEGEHALVLRNRAGPTALGTDLGDRSRLRAGPPARPAGGRALDPQRHRRAVDGVLERDPGFRLEVPASGLAPPAASPGPAEQAPEKVTEVATFEALRVEREPLDPDVPPARPPTG